MTPAQNYAQALRDLIRDTDVSKHEGISDTFIAVLKKKGHISLLPTILKEFEKYRMRDLDTKRVILTVAKSEDAEKYKSEASKYVATLDNEEHIGVKVDKRLIGGFKLESGDMVVDGSYKRRLLNLYREIIT